MHSNLYLQDIKYDKANSILRVQFLYLSLLYRNQVSPLIQIPTLKKTCPVMSRPRNHSLLVKGFFESWNKYCIDVETGKKKSTIEIL